MKINRAQYEEAYKAGKKYYERRFGLTEAKKSLAAIGLNQNSAGDLVYNVCHMLDGECFKRSMSTAVIDDYLAWILRDYGPTYLRKAVSAVEQHIRYCQSFNNSPMRPQIKVLEAHRKLLADEVTDFLSPEEIAIDKKLSEGRVKTVTVNYYERNAKARDHCIEAHGTICKVCGFDFGKTYGAIGDGFIHVHHLRDLASIGKEYEVNPTEDLCPVCPNCHAMLHRMKPPFTVAELQKVIANQRNKSQ